MAEEVKKTNDSNLLAAVSYLWILSVIIYVIKKDDSYIQFHAKQGIVIFLFWLLCFVPVIGWMFSWLISLIALILIIVGAVKAYNGEKYKIPVVSGLAEKINF